MQLILRKAASKKLRRIQPKLAAAIVTALESIAAAPYAHHANVTRLEGARDSFRLRHGDWRVLYMLDRQRNEMIVDCIVQRGEAYR